jgi:hypothetical protein
MLDAGIGRLLIASLHQGIADVAPSRLEYYEHWLSPTGMKEGRLGLAPLGAALSFLHREDAPDNARIPARAGTCAADWTFAGTSRLRLAAIHRLPTWWRTRTAMRLSRRLIQETASTSKVKIRLRRGRGTIEIRSPLFEQLRHPATVPMGAFYGAAVLRFLQLCELDGEVTLDPETTSGCRLTISVRKGRLCPPAVESA